MIDKNDLVLLVIDVQDKLLPRISKSDKAIPNMVKLIRFARELQIPFLVTEQYPEGLGGTTKAILDEIGDTEPIPKMTFGCMEEEGFRKALEATGRSRFSLREWKRTCA